MYQERTSHEILFRSSHFICDRSIGAFVSWDLRRLNSTLNLKVMVHKCRTAKNTMWWSDL